MVDYFNDQVLGPIMTDMNAISNGGMSPESQPYILFMDPLPPRIPNALPPHSIKEIAAKVFMLLSCTHAIFNGACAVWDFSNSCTTTNSVVDPRVTDNQAESVSCHWGPLLPLLAANAIFAFQYCKVAAGLRFQSRLDSQVKINLIGTGLIAVGLGGWGISSNYIISGASTIIGGSLAVITGIFIWFFPCP